MTTSTITPKTQRDLAALIKTITQRGYDVEVNYKNCGYILVIKHPSLLSGYIAQILIEYGFKQTFCYTKLAVNLDNVQLHQSVFELDLVTKKPYIKTHEA